MRLVDSSAWIEVLLGTPTGRAVMRHLPDRESWIVPTLVQYEIHKWLARTVSSESARDFISYSSKCAVVELSSIIAVRASEVASLHRLSTADAIIYATALEQGADLLSCDAHFEDLPQIVYLPKQSG